MRTLLFVALVAAFAFGSACGSSTPELQGCQDYYQQNLPPPDGPGITPTQQDFCLNQGAKQDGNCCVANSQCISGQCCPWGQTCGARDSCECVGP